MRFHVFHYLAIAACAQHPGRGADDSPPSSKDNTRPIGVKRDSVVRLHHSELSGMDTAVRLVLRDSISWARVWPRLGRSTAPPLVNFSNHMIVVAAMGTLSSGGYEITIDSVKTAGSEYLIFVRIREPAEDCGVPLTLTQPVDVVRVPRRTLPTRFVESTEVRRC